MALPAELTHAIERETSRFKSAALRRAAEELSCSYRDEGAAGKQRSAFGSPAECAAYLLTRLPATFAAISAVLREVKQGVPDFRPRSLLDLGAGPGTAAWAASEIFPEIERLMLVERDQATVA